MEARPPLPDEHQQNGTYGYVFLWFRVVVAASVASHPRTPYAFWVGISVYPILADFFVFIFRDPIWKTNARERDTFY